MSVARLVFDFFFVILHPGLHVFVRSLGFTLGNLTAVLHSLHCLLHSWVGFLFDSFSEGRPLPLDVVDCSGGFVFPAGSLLAEGDTLQLELVRETFTSIQQLQPLIYELTEYLKLQHLL